MTLGTNVITIGETIVIHLKCLKWGTLAAAHVCVLTEQTGARVRRQTVVAQRVRMYMEPVLLLFDRDLFGHTLCASCQPRSTAAI